MGFKKFQPNTKIKSAEVNDNYAFISGNRLIAVNPNTGAAIGTFPIGDLSAIANGSLAGDLLGRSGSGINVYTGAGALVGTVSYDQLLNLQDASETQRGTAEIATQAEVDAGTDDERIVTPLKMLGLFGLSDLSATNGQIKIPINVGGSFSEFIVKFGSSFISTGGGTSIVFSEAFPTSFIGAFAFSRSAPSNTNSQRLYITSQSISQVTFVNPRNTGDAYWFAIGR